MKTAISLPDAVFDEAEKLAHRSGMSRSELYRLALEDYLALHDTDRVRDAINAALERIERADNDFVNAAASRVLAKTEW